VTGMNAVLDYCLTSQKIVDRAKTETDPARRRMMIEDARFWFAMAEAKLKSLGFFG
jgi:hypothetical protein